MIDRPPDPPTNEELAEFANVPPPLDRRNPHKVRFHGAMRPGRRPPIVATRRASRLLWATTAACTTAMAAWLTWLVVSSL